MAANYVGNISAKVTANIGAFLGEMHKVEQESARVKAVLAKPVNVPVGTVSQDSQLKQLQKSLGGQSDIGRTLALLRGGGAFAGLTIASRRLADMADNAERMTVAFREGQMSLGEMVNNLVESVPLIGDVFKLGKSIGRLAGIGRNTEATPEDKARLALEPQKAQANTIRDTAIAATKAIKNELGSIGAEGFDAERKQAEQEWQSVKDSLREERKKLADLSDIGERKTAENALMEQDTANAERLGRKLGDIRHRMVMDDEKYVREIQQRNAKVFKEALSDFKARQAREHKQLIGDILEDAIGLGRDVIEDMKQAIQDKEEADKLLSVKNPFMDHSIAAAGFTGGTVSQRSFSPLEDLADGQKKQIRLMEEQIRILEEQRRDQGRNKQ